MQFLGFWIGAGGGLLLGLLITVPIIRGLQQANKALELRVDLLTPRPPEHPNCRCMLPGELLQDGSGFPAEPLQYLPPQKPLLCIDCGQPGPLNDENRCGVCQLMANVGGLQDA